MRFKPADEYTWRRRLALLVLFCFAILAIAIIALFFPMNSTGPQGEIGPTGPQGEIGPTGPQGEIGPTGLESINGTCGAVLEWNPVAETWESTTIPFVLSFSITPTTSSYFVTGDYTVTSTGLTGTYTPGTPQWWRVSHFFMRVNSLTGSGTVTVTGSRIRSDGVREVGFSEQMVIDVGGGQEYQTITNFAEITQVVIPAGITAIDYDIGHVRYWDQGDRPFQILGVRMELRGQNQNTDAQLRIRKVQSDSSTNANKFSLVTLEDFFVDSGAGTGILTDNVRTGPADRSYSLAMSFFNTNEPYTAKYLDYPTYFGDTSIIRSQREEGLIVDLINLNQNREISLWIFYYPLNTAC